MGPSVPVQPQLTSPKASGDGIWSGGRGRAAVLRSTTDAPQTDGDQPGADQLSSPDRTIHGSYPAPPFDSPKRASTSVTAAALPHAVLPLRAATDDAYPSPEDDDFEPRRPIIRSSAALFDPSPAALRPSEAPNVAIGEESMLRDEERASIEDKLANINLGLSAGEGQGASVIGPPASSPSAAGGGPGLTYSSIVRRV
jgi:hypothetical protein